MLLFSTRLNILRKMWDADNFWAAACVLEVHIKDYLLDNLQIIVGLNNMQSWILYFILI